MSPEDILKMIGTLEVCSPALLSDLSESHLLLLLVSENQARSGQAGRREEEGNIQGKADAEAGQGCCLQRCVITLCVLGG